ncbi:DUF881 domain-containing protein [Nocardioides carbamazepini]|uniref:DUF881 domain-containing protein n=1 Tax=Nocardioides carbamazepini TaxID=2854259 RepID=UPI002149FBA4|nr:DUF881 domain-containing protein [Nocardioides carbamazepini]MCR1785377.1 DUF881 domain-containing protein [Nocardioides carbamazepini]
MTGTHAGGTTGRRPEAARRSLAWRVGTPAVVLLSGALLAVSATNSEGSDLRPGRYTDLSGLVEGEAADYRKVEARYQNLSDQVDRLTGAVSDRGVRDARREIAKLRDPAGMTPRTGPGLQITLSDAPEELLDEAVERNKGLDPEQRLNLNRFVVHQQDIQAVVNALWMGGASAVTIAGQRVISTTGIRCKGPVVQLQGEPFPQPYVIEAVGDPSELYGSVAADPIVAGYRKDADNPLIEMGWSLDFEDRIEAPAYDGVVDLQYARPLG